MFLDFQEAIAALGGQEAVVRVANEARSPADYLLATLLPERNMPTYHIDSGSMVVRATMAGMVGMDSPYAPGGMVETNAFLEQTAKFANEVQMNEATLRQLQEFMMRLFAQTGSRSPEALAQEALNFLDKVIIQPHHDRMEWLRGQCLVFGEIDWTFNGKTLTVDYGIPADNLLPARAGADAYAGATSKFWTDIRLLRRRVKNMRAILAHSDTIEEIQYNDANALVLTAQANNQFTFRRVVNNSAQFSLDANDSVTIIAYDKEGEVLNPADPETTQVVPFLERGKLLAVGQNSAQGYQPGQGTMDEDPDAALALGYTHIAPTIEGGGRPGRWAELMVPEARKYQLIGHCVTNGLPVLEAPAKVAVATTAMS